MERKGGCCLAPRYGGAGAGAGGQAWQMGRVMLKFRPIAPKPAAMAPVPSPAPAPAAAAAVGRGKRKAVGGGGGRRGRKPKKAATVAPVMAAPMAAGDRKECEKEKSLSSRSTSSSGTTSVDSSSPQPPAPAPKPATLPLMPVSPAEEKVGLASEEPSPVATLEVASQLVAPQALRPAAAACVTVEEVTATWRDGEAPCCGVDDDAPAFVSDQWGRVTWSNPAFTRAVSGDSCAPAGALPAWGTCAGFTCRVRVRHGSPRRGGSVVAPCDVWRLDTGGCYLWRLDLQAALTLGGLP